MKVRAREVEHGRDERAVGERSRAGECHSRRRRPVEIERAALNARNAAVEHVRRVYRKRPFAAFYESARAGEVEPPGVCAAFLRGKNESVAFRNDAEIVVRRIEGEGLGAGIPFGIVERQNERSGARAYRADRVAFQNGTVDEGEIV